MNNSIPILSICIPTFNRLHYLKESLDILLPQVENLNVEVCVSDNQSTDGTVIYLAGINKRFSKLKFIIQKENIGLERNMISAISIGQGDYILPIGDDEVLPNGTVEIILNELNEDSDVIILDGWHTDAYLLPKKRHLPNDIQGVYFSSPSEAFANLWDKMPPGSFMASRLYFSTDYLNRFIGTSHAYTGAIWDALANKYRENGECKIKCMSMPTVLLRGGEKSWRKDTARIMLYEIPKWFSLIMENEEYKSTVSPIRSDFLDQQTRIGTLILFRAMGQLDECQINELGQECSDKQIKRMYIVTKIPNFIIDLLSICLRKFNIIKWHIQLKSAS